MNNGLIKGPATAWFQDADLSWIPGLLVTGVVYLVLTIRNSRVSAPTVGARV